MQLLFLNSNDSTEALVLQGTALALGVDERRRQAQAFSYFVDRQHRLRAAKISRNRCVSINHSGV